MLKRIREKINTIYENLKKPLAVSPQNRESVLQWIDSNIGVPEKGHPWSISDLASLSILVTTCLGVTIFLITLYTEHHIPTYLYSLNPRSATASFFKDDSLAGFLTVTSLYIFGPYAFMRFLAAQINHKILRYCDKALTQFPLLKFVYIFLLVVCCGQLLSVLTHYNRKLSFTIVILFFVTIVFVAKKITLKARLGLFICLGMLAHIVPAMPTSEVGQNITYLHTTIPDDKYNLFVACKLERVGDLLSITTPEDIYHINIATFSHFSPIEAENMDIIAERCKSAIEDKK